MVTTRLKADSGWIDASYDGETVTLAAVSPSLHFLVTEPVTIAQRQKRTDERGRYRRMALDALRDAGVDASDLDEAEFTWTYRAG